MKKKQKKKENLQPPGVSNKCNIIANLKCFATLHHILFFKIVTTSATLSNVLFHKAKIKYSFLFFKDFTYSYLQWALNISSKSRASTSITQLAPSLKPMPYIKGNIKDVSYKKKQKTISYHSN